MSDKNMGAENLQPGGSNAPSVGRVGGIDYDPAGNRVKGFITSKFTPVAGGLEFQRSEQLARENGATRGTLRFIVPNERIDQAAKTAERFGYGQEGRISLNHHLSDVSILYYGKNEPNRNPAADVFQQEMDLVNKIKEGDVKDVGKIITDTLQDYSLERLTGEVSPEDHARLVEIYKKSFTKYLVPIEEVIFDMIKSPSVQVYVARSRADGALQAVCATEQVDVTLPDGRKMAIREMGDSAKMPEAKGLNAPLKLMLTKEAADDGVDLLYCESRAVLGAVNAINHSISMEHSGYLPAHTLIDGAGQIRQDGDYGDLHIWSFNREQIESVGAQVAQALHT